MTIKALIKRAFFLQIIFEIVYEYDIMYMLQGLAKLGRLHLFYSDRFMVVTICIY